MDIWDKKKRSEVMSKIRSKNTKPEMILRKALFALGYRYRINYKKLLGKPDIVLPKYKTVIFVHGCFWHGHEQNKCRFKIAPPCTNINYWNNKIKRNKERDNENTLRLSSTGWQIITVWECEISKKNMQVLIVSIIDLLKRKAEEKYTKVKIYEMHENQIVKVAEDIVEYNPLNLEST